MARVYAPVVARVLLVEDDEDIGSSLERVLGREGHHVVRTAHGRQGVERATHERFDLLVLDLGLPDIEGLEVCRQVRQVRPEQLILMLTARAEEIDTVVGLDAGADDYVTKPFRLAELLARVRALLRRTARQSDESLLEGGQVRIDVRARRAWDGDRELELTPKEFDLLALLVKEKGAAVSRGRIIDEVWDPHWFGPTKTLDMHILSLRRKLGEHAAGPGTITTVRGVGYRFEAD
jgi:DNA-binding response OmpR family regulator